MFIRRRLFSILVILALVLSVMPGLTLAAPRSMPLHQGVTPTPVVAIHVSELTQALETMPAVPPTPTGTGYSGYQWFYTSWHYFVMYESLKIALESDGTPYVVVTDADIAAGALRNSDGSPKYPIVFSLASEAVADNEVQPLRDYVNAGGFLFVGSSAFTRNPNGTTRGDFALASEMGLDMVNHNLQNWALNASFTHLTDHRLVSHIPSGTVGWDMLTNAEDVTWGTSGAQQLWQVVTNGAEVIATGGNYPLLATKSYGSGRFIYHAIFNPIVGAGGQDSGMYAYTIYRSAVEWAFEAANLPIVKSSPWPYAYDAALMVRHDFENYLGSLTSIAASAQYEQSVGAKGDYYFCTGILRTLPPADQQPYIASMRSAISNYGATIGSHNGGYPNIGVTDPNAYDYWHWGPDTMLDRISGFPAPYENYANGYNYAKDSIRISFQDLAGWFTGLDNGRAGCGAAGNCPNTWVSPYFNSGRDRSLKILSELGSVVMGEQKISPFPHITLSYDPATPNHRYNPITLPPSDWYVGSTVSQSQEAGHNAASIQAMVDFYFQKGYLLNLYGHSASTGGNMKIYLDDAIAKGSRLWATNSVGLSDWWGKRAALVVTPAHSKSGETAIASAAISGSTDPQAAIELVLPNWSSGVVGNLEVRLNGSLANSSEFRSTNYGVKVRVGTAVTNVEVRYQPLEGWAQTDWAGGSGQATWSDTTHYASATHINDVVTGQISLNQAAGGASLFSDDFTRTIPPDPTPVPFSWITPGISENYGVFNTTGGALNTSLNSASQYGFAYKNVPTQPAGDYTIETDIRFPNTTNGGGIFGRLNPATGTRYAIWIYPSSTLRLIRFNSWPGSPWVNLGEYTIPGGVGTSWHHIKMVFSGSNIQVFYDNGTTPTHNVTDANYSTGVVGVDYWSTTTYGPSYNNYVVKDNLGNVLFQDNFGDDPTVPDVLPPWSVYNGTWSVVSSALRATAVGTNNYANIYYSPGTPWSDYSVQARVQYPSGVLGGGLVGRLNPTTGTRYTAWVYPGTSTLNLLKWSNWTTWGSVTSALISPVGEGWHSVKMDFSGSRIRVYWDGSLLIDATDSSYSSGGIGFDTAAPGAAYLMAADDVEVRGPTQYETSGVLTSSAFDGGVGVNWYSLAYDASVPGAASACVRTRTADRADLLAAATWSACYSAGVSQVTSPNKRWIQYQVELGTGDTAVTPVFYENRITYSPGSYLPQSTLTYNAPASGDSQTSVNLSATLLDENNAPLTGRTVNFSLNGIPSVSGVTNSSGIATAPLSLNIAPGIYPMTVTFAGDSAYGPSSTSASFTVTESWSEWIQDSGADFAAGIGSDIDTSSVSGSVVLRGQVFGEGEETGRFILNGQTWQYRHRLLIDNPNTSELAEGYSLKVVVDTNALVSAGKLLGNGNDLRLVWSGGSSPLELDRVADTAFNVSDTQLWFKSQAAIPASSQDNSYYIYYGNPDAGAPPADPRNVFALYDGFDGSAIDAALWTTAGTVSESGGWAHLSPGGDLFGKQSSLYGLLEMRVQAATAASYMWWGWEDGASDAPNFVVFEYYTPPVNLAALLRADNAAYQTLTLTAQPSGGVTSPHIYATEWRPGLARWYIDGAQVQSNITNGVPHTTMRPNLNANTVAFDVDWVRARPLAKLDPVVTLASAYTGYSSPGTFTSSAMDTGGSSAWKYLVWDALTPSGTSLTLRLRTAQTLGDLATANWVDYAQTGLLITNSEARWIQYEATLRTNNGLITPELQKVTIYYSGQSVTPPPPLPAHFYGEIHIIDNAPSAGAAIEVTIPGVTGHAATAIARDNSGTLIYTADVPGDIVSTPGKEGGAEGDIVTFSVGGRIVATSVWHSGTNARLDLHPPDANVVASGATNEGSPITLNGTSADWGSDLATYGFDCDGNGVYEVGPQASPIVQCPALDNGPHNVGARVVDAQGGVGNQTTTLSVADVPPTNVNAGGPYPGVAGQSVPFIGTATCAPNDGCMYAWDLDGDGTFGGPGESGPSVSYTWNTIGSYTVVLHVTDDDGNVVAATATVAVTGATHSLALMSGWNLVSFNLTPQNNSIASVLSGLGADYDLVYAWDASQQAWLKYDRDAPPYVNTLSTLDPTQGFWIHVITPGTLEVVGNVSTTASMALVTGWNLVGYPSVTNRDLPGALQDHGLGIDFSLVYAYHANDASDPWKLFDRTAVPYANDLHALAPGWGYWVRANAAHIWTVPYAAP